MHASYQIIIQVLQLAYTTQACISNLRNLCNASKHMTMQYQMQPIKVHKLAPPTCVLLLSRILILSHSSMFFNVAPSLFMSMSNFYFFVSISPKLYFFELYFFVSISPKAFMSLYNLSPFVINFHKRCASY